jgi:hypothetical protein
MSDFVLTIPEAFAIIGSVSAIVFAAFLYMRRMKNPPLSPHVESPEEKLVVCKEQVDAQIQLQHERISVVKDKVAECDADIRLAASKIDTIQKMLNDHEDRDVRDFTVLNKKLDKLTDIVIRILSDDKL